MRFKDYTTFLKIFFRNYIGNLIINMQTIIVMTRRMCLFIVLTNSFAMSSFMMKTYYGHYGKAKQNRIFLNMQGQTNLCLLAGGGR